MRHLSRRRLALALALALVPIGPTPAHAAGHSRTSVRASWVAPADWLRALRAVWLMQLASVANKEGCTIDPNGLCGGKAISRPAGPAGENGCTIDPNGQCAVAPSTDGGCTIDPNGHCAPGH